MTDIDVTDHNALERALAPIEADIARMEADALEAAREAHRWGLKRITRAEVEYIQSHPGYSRDEEPPDRDDPTTEEDR